MKQCRANDQVSAKKGLGEFLNALYVLNLELLAGNGGKIDGPWGESEPLSDDESIIFVFSDEADVEWFFCENK